MRNLRAEIAEGLRFLFGHRLLRACVLLVSASNLAFMAGEAVLVLFATEELGLGSRGYGLLLAAVALGGVPGSLLAARVGGRVPPGPLIVGGVLVGAVVMACFGLATDPWVAGAAYVVTGAVWGVWNVTLLSLRQAIVPDRLMGRVVGAVRLIGFGSIPVGALLGGLVARSLGLRAPFLLGAAVLAVAALVADPGDHHQRHPGRPVRGRRRAAPARLAHRDLARVGHPGRVEAGPGRLLGEPDGVADRAAARVVVEVDVGVGAGTDKAGQPARPGGQGLAVVAGPRVGGALVQAQVGPVGGAPERGRAVRAVGQAQGRPVLAEQVADLLGPPAVVAGLDRDPGPGRERPQGPVEGGRVGLRVGGSWSRTGPSLSPRWRARSISRPTGSSGSREALMVGQEPAGLDGHHEPGGVRSAQAAKVCGSGSR